MTEEKKVEEVVVPINREKVLVLPVSEAKVTLKDPRKLLMEDRDFAYDQIGDLTGTLATRALMKGVIAVAIKDWELPLSIPSVDINSIKKMYPEDFDFLNLDVNIGEIEAVIYGTKTAKTGKNMKDPKAGTRK